LSFQGLECPGAVPMKGSGPNLIQTNNCLDQVLACTARPGPARPVPNLRTPIASQALSSNPDPQPSYPNPQPSYPNPEPSYPNPEPSHPNLQSSYPNPEPSHPNPQPSYPNPAKLIGGRGGVAFLTFVCDPPSPLIKIQF